MLLIIHCTTGPDKRLAEMMALKCVWWGPHQLFRCTGLLSLPPTWRPCHSKLFISPDWEKHFVSSNQVSAAVHMHSCKDPARGFSQGTGAACLRKETFLPKPFSREYPSSNHLKVTTRTKLMHRRTAKIYSHSNCDLIVKNYCHRKKKYMVL